MRLKVAAASGKEGEEEDGNDDKPKSKKAKVYTYVTPPYIVSDHPSKHRQRLPSQIHVRSSSLFVVLGVRHSHFCEAQRAQREASCAEDEEEGYVISLVVCL